MQRQSTWIGVGVLCAGLLAACGSDDEGGEAIVGSGNEIEVTTDVMFVERVSIEMPFHATVYNGEPMKVMLSGEDNLVSLIAVEEVEVGSYEITAPYDIEFEQHDDIAIEIPFLDMVEITVDGDHITLGEDTVQAWRDASQDGE